MAILQAATTSTGAIVSDLQAVRELCENHCFGTLNWEVTEEGELTIWGYDDFEVYQARENGLPDYESRIEVYEFLRELADHLDHKDGDTSHPRYRPHLLIGTQLVVLIDGLRSSRRFLRSA